jgi:hypothetical protein
MDMQAIYPMLFTSWFQAKEVTPYLYSSLRGRAQRSIMMKHLYHVLLYLKSISVFRDLLALRAELGAIKHV